MPVPVHSAHGRVTDVTPGAPPAGGFASIFPVPPQELQRPVSLHCVQPETDMMAPLIDGSKLEAVIRAVLALKQQEAGR
jgi:hypothetical protein